MSPYPDSYKPIVFLVIVKLDDNSYSFGFLNKGHEFLILSTYILSRSRRTITAAPHTFNRMMAPLEMNRGLNLFVCLIVMFYFLLACTFLFFLCFKFFTVCCLLFLLSTCILLCFIFFIAHAFVY